VRRLSGTVVLATPLSVRLLGLFFGGIVVAAVLFVSMAIFARKETVTGWQLRTEAEATRERSEQPHPDIPDRPNEAMRKLPRTGRKGKARLVFDCVRKSPRWGCYSGAGRANEESKYGP
jgi:hypothetical protein